MESTASSSTSLNLIMRAKHLDGHAWERLSRLYCPLVLEWVLRAKVPREDAPDVVQEVFLAVSSGITRFRSENGKQKFRGWLWGITRHKILDYYRNWANRPIAEGGSAVHLRIQAIPDLLNLSDGDSLNNSDKSVLMMRALEIIKTDFAETTWRAFWQVTVEGLPPSDVARELGMSVGAVYTAKSRVLSTLRRQLNDLESTL